MKDWQFAVPHRKLNYQKNRFCVDNCNTEYKMKETAQCLALEVNERMEILHDLTGSTFLVISNSRGNILGEKIRKTT